MERKLMKRFLFLMITTALFLFTGCVNDINNSASLKESERPLVEVGGSLQLTGALPAELVSLTSLSLSGEANLSLSGLTGQSRTAYPGIPAATALTYTITAKNTATGSTESYTGTVSSDNNSYSVGIPVTDTARNFKVYVSVSQNNAEVLSGVSSEFSISNTTRTKSNADITLAPSQTSSKKGCFSLNVTVASDTGINSAKVIPEGAVTVGASKNGTLYTFNYGSVTDGVCTGITSKAYPSTFYFYSATGTLLYSFTTTINIFDFMTTNTWINNGSEPYFVTTTSGGVTTTTCKITKALVDDFGITEIYVDSSKQTANSSNTSTYTTASGTFMNPVTDLASAIAKLKNKDADYKIWIKGTLTGNQSIGTSLKKMELVLTMQILLQSADQEA